MINKQQHKMSCGPVVIMNCIKYLGGSLSYNKYIDMFTTLGFGFKTGMYKTLLIKTLRVFGIKFKKSNDDIDSIIERGNSMIILQYYINKKTYKLAGHYIFVHGNNKTRNNYVNISGKKGTLLLTQKQFLDRSYYHEIFEILS